MSAQESRPPASTDEDRRRIVAGLAALLASSAAGPLGAQPAPLADPASFANLTRTITGFAFADAATANATIDALTAAVGADNLRRIGTLAAVTPPAQLATELRVAGLERAARTVVDALWTGTIDSPQGSRVISYEHALIWQALPWTKPNTACGGEVNYWSTAPAVGRLSARDVSETSS
jgi:hypothetical protein